MTDRPKIAPFLTLLDVQEGIIDPAMPGAISHQLKKAATCANGDRASICRKRTD